MNHLLCCFKLFLNNALSRILIKLLYESADPTVLAVAVHDVGQYVKHYERGKK